MKYRFPGSGEVFPPSGGPEMRNKNSEIRKQTKKNSKKKRKLGKIQHFVKHLGPSPTYLYFNGGPLAVPTGFSNIYTFSNVVAGHRRPPAAAGVLLRGGRRRPRRSRPSKEPVRRRPRRAARRAGCQGIPRNSLGIPGNS